MYTKAIISNKFIEITHQALPPFQRSASIGGRRSSSFTQSENYEANRKASINRARKEIRRLIECNFPSEYTFITLTFGNNVDFDTKDINVCNKVFSDFKKRLSYFLKKHSHSPMKYIGVTEFQDNRGGHIHFHLICNLTRLTKENLESIWSYGLVQKEVVVSNPLDNEKISYYLKKGIADPRLNGKKKYMRSQSLSKPTELVIKNPSELKDILDNAGSIALSHETYSSPLYGDIQYETFYTFHKKELNDYAETIK